MACAYVIYEWYLRVNYVMRNLALIYGNFYLDSLTVFISDFLKNTSSDLLLDNSRIVIEVFAEDFPGSKLII